MGTVAGTLVPPDRLTVMVRAVLISLTDWVALANCTVGAGSLSVIVTVSVAVVPTCALVNVPKPRITVLLGELNLLSSMGVIVKIALVCPALMVNDVLLTV